MSFQSINWCSPDLFTRACNARQCTKYDDAFFIVFLLQQGVVAGVVRLLGCLLKGLGTAKPEDFCVSLTLLLEDLLVIVYRVLNLQNTEYYRGKLSATCSRDPPPFSDGTPDNSVCGPPIKITLPEIAKIGTCSNETLVACPQNAPAQSQQYSNLFTLLGCVLNNLGQQTLDNVVKGLLCDILRTLLHLVGQPSGTGIKEAGAGTALEPVGNTLGDNAGQLLDALRQEVNKLRNALSAQCPNLA
ncbi:uncharacterized protein LOC135392579 [Ornithodoros turicata]|uniref:uncharacterized protein LOC135392579 n=1 Tax=Ornithodoros turicata TaxID=34597 RepID=UPI00313946F6